MTMVVDRQEIAAALRLRRDMVVLAALLLLAAGIRLWWLDQPLIDAFSWRQASTAMIAENIPVNGWNIFFPEVNWTGPGPSYQGREFQIYTLIVALVQAVTGMTDAAGRLVSTLFGLLTLFSLHRITAMIWTTAHAHAAGLAYALMPAAVMIDTSFLPDATMLALLTLGVFLYLRYAAGGSDRMLVLAAAAFGLGVLAKLPGLGVGLVIAYLAGLLYLRGDRRRLLRSLAAMVIVLAFIIAYYAWAIHLGNSYPPYHVAGSGYIWDEGLRAFMANGFFLDRTWKIAQVWFYGWPILILVGIGLWLHPRPADVLGDRALIWCPLLWLVAAVTVYLLAAGEVSANPWNMHIFSVPLAIFAGHGALVLVRLARPAPAVVAGMRMAGLVALIAIFATLPLVQSMKAPFSRKAHALGLELAALRAEGDLVIAVSPDVGDPIAIFYAGARGWVFPPGGGSEPWSIFRADDAAAIADLEQLRAEGARWFGFTTDARDDLGRLFTEHHAGFITWLDAQFERAADTADYVIFRL